VKPVLQALILADHIYEDIRTRKKIIAGTFTALHFKRTPPQAPPGDSDDPAAPPAPIPGGAQAGSPWVYISMTDFVGDDEFVLRYVDLRDDTVVLGTEFRIKSDNPLQTIELCVPLPPLPTPHAGDFAVELLWKDEPLGSWRVSVNEIRE